MDLPEFKYLALAFQPLKRGDLAGSYVLCQEPEVFESIEDVRQMFRGPAGATEVIYELKEIERG